MLAEEQQWAKLRMIVELADEVWGADACDAPSRRFAPIMSAACCARRALRRRARKRERGEITPAELKAIEDREIAALIKKQEAVGLQVDHRRRIPPRLLADRFPGRRSTASNPIVGERKFKFQGPQPRPILLRINKKLGGYVPHPMIEHFKFVQAHTKRRRR